MISFKTITFTTIMISSIHTVARNVFLPADSAPLHFAEAVIYFQSNQVIAPAQWRQNETDLNFYEQLELNKPDKENLLWPPPCQEVPTLKFRL